MSEVLTEFTELSEFVRVDYDLAGQVIGCAMEVHRELGPGFLESVYSKALQHQLRKHGFDPQAEEPISVFFDGVVVGQFFADLLVEDLVIELKAVERLVKSHEVQVVNYLNATHRNDGLLLNFGASSLEFRRKFRRRANPKFS